MSGLVWVVVFGKERAGKVRKRVVDVAKVYLGAPARGRKPLFKARVDGDLVKMALQRFGASFREEGGHLVVEGGDEAERAVRRLVVYIGARQFTGPAAGARLLELVEEMAEIELTFWYSRFLTAFEKGTYWDVGRVAKALRTLYRVQ